MFFSFYLTPETVKVNDPFSLKMAKPQKTWDARDTCPDKRKRAASRPPSCVYSLEIDAPDRLLAAQEFLPILEENLDLVGRGADHHAQPENRVLQQIFYLVFSVHPIAEGLLAMHARA